MICKDINIWENTNTAINVKMSTYILDGNKKRGAVLIAPGGGYEFVSDREAEPIALKFNAAGFNAFVLYYRVAPNRHPAPILDISRAMCVIRENARQWNIDDDKIAVCGFSAGGHLAASLGVHWNKDYVQNTEGIIQGKNKPNALILCYPVITSGEFAHKGSFANLLVENENALMAEMSLENQIGMHTPPTFLWHTVEDASVPVENSLLFAQGLRNNNIPFEMHIYPFGGHGLSLATEETFDQRPENIEPHVQGWMDLCIKWLNITFKED